MNCDVTFETLAAFTAGDLDPARQMELEAHASGCPSCRRRLAALNRTEAQLRTLPRLDCPDDALLSVRRRLLDEVGKQQAPEVMTLAEVAEFLRVSLDDLDQLTVDLPVFEISGRIRVRRSSLLAWIAARERVYQRETIASELARSAAGDWEQE